MISGRRVDLQSLFSDRPGSENISEIAEEITKGAVFIYPTETIYGIGGVVKEPVKKRIISIKQREPDNPMLVIAGKRSDFSVLGLDYNVCAQKLMRKFWPGNVTLVLRQKTGEGKWAVRISDHPFLKLLFSFIDTPIYSTSANISGRDYEGCPGRIYETFKNDMDFMVDAGELPVSKPSTIVDVSDEENTAVLREGTVSEKEVMNCIG